MRKRACFQDKLIIRFGQCRHDAKALMNSIRIKWIATGGNRKLVMKQGKMIGYLSQRTMDYYQSSFQNVAFCAKWCDFANERKTQASCVCY
jgi:hypothetical protein